MHGSATLSAGIVAFGAVLRERHRFAVGVPEERDALRALAIVGVDDRRRVRSALRLVFCSDALEASVFDRAFDDFFDSAQPGSAQVDYAPRHTRPSIETSSADSVSQRGRRAGIDAAGNVDPEAGVAPERRAPSDSTPSDAAGRDVLRARYSPHAGRGTEPVLDGALLAKLRPIAATLVREIDAGRTRRWNRATSAGRVDLKRTIRAAVHTGGEPIAVRYRGRPRRNPRFVVLVDGSRSMIDHTRAVVAFAAALCERTTRAAALFFSTALRDVTHELRNAARLETAIGDAGDAWGGGTKIGAGLTRFIDDHAARLLTSETLVIICSDGLDDGDAGSLERAVREIDRRSAGIVWLNPHAASPGYRPTARGMRVALPYVTLLVAPSDAVGFASLVGRMVTARSLRTIHR